MQRGKVKIRSASVPAYVVVCLLVIIAGGMLLRVWARAGQTVWFDEAFSWRLAAFPWSELLRRATLDNNPPLYYLLLKCWIALAGESAFALSSLSIALSGLACAGMFAFVLEAYGGKVEQRAPLDAAGIRWLALFTAALLATSGFQIYWGAQVRMYALLAALAIVSSWLLLRAMHDRRRALRRWLAYALVTLLLAYSHTYALFTIAAHVIYVAGSLLAGVRGKLRAPAHVQQFSGPLLAAAVFAVGWLPWLPVLLRQQAQVSNAFWLPPLTWWNVRHAWHMLTAGPSLGGTGGIHSAVGVVCLAGVLLLFWRPRPADRLVFLAAIVPLAAGILVSAFDRNILSPRYLIAAQPFVLLAAARIALVLPSVRLRTAIASLLILLNIVLNRDLSIAAARTPSGIRAAAQYVDATRTDGAPVIGTCPLVFLPLIYHLRSPARAHLFTDGMPIPHFEGSAVFKEDELLTAGGLRRLRARQVFVVRNACHLGQQTGEVAVPENWRLVRQAQFEETAGIPGRVTVAEYRMN